MTSGFDMYVWFRQNGRDWTIQKGMDVWLGKTGHNFTHARSARKRKSFYACV